MTEAILPMTRGEKMLYDEIKSLHKKIDAMTEQRALDSIEEISMGKACKLLRRGEEAIIKLINNGKLKAIPYRDNKHKKRYRFRLADIRAYQQEQSTKLISETLTVKPAEEIGREIFGGNARTKNKRENVYA